MNNDTKKIFKELDLTKKNLDKKSIKDLEEAMQAIQNAHNLKKETTGIAEVYADSIKNLLNKNETNSKVTTENKETKNDIQQQENAALTKIKELINKADDKKLDAKERKTKFDKIKNKIKKAFFGSTKTKGQQDISELFQRFSNDDNTLIFDAIDATLKKISNGENLVDFFNNPIIRYILYHSKVFPTFKNSFMQNVNKIVEVLPNVLKESQIRFGKTLGQAIRKQLYNGTNNKFQNWVLILGPASRKGSKNVKNIISNTKAALKNMWKNLNEVDVDEIDNKTKTASLEDICKKIGKEKEPILYLKLGLLSDVNAPAAVTKVINAVRRIKGKTDIEELKTVNITDYNTIKDLDEKIMEKIENAVNQGKAEENK